MLIIISYINNLVNELLEGELGNELNSPSVFDGGESNQYY